MGTTSMNVTVRYIEKFCFLKYIARLLLALCFVLSGSASLTSAKSHKEQLKEYELKAAYIYNFIKFTDWPKDTFKEEKDPLIIGVFNEDQQKSLSKILKEKKKDNRPIQIVHLKNDDDKSEKKLQSCQVLFFPDTLKKSDELVIFKHIKNHPILTIGERNQFLETGGMINFILEKKKIRFEINLIEADKAKLQIRAKLVRLAKRVIKKEESDKEEETHDKEK